MLYSRAKTYAFAITCVTCLSAVTQAMTAGGTSDDCTTPLMIGDGPTAYSTTGNNSTTLSDTSQSSGARRSALGGPGNDDCAGRIDIFDGDTEYDTNGASTDGPQHGPDGPCEFDGQTYHDIWYNFDATCTGDLTVSTCNQADYDTDLVVYDGCDCNNLLLLGCNDDGAGCAGFSSHLVVPVTEGNCYKIRVGGLNEGDQGTAVLTVSCFIPPECGNGECEEGESECSCPADCPVDLSCFLFNNHSEFEAFNQEEGKTLK